MGSARASKTAAVKPDGDGTTAELLLEIGTEELPYQFVSPALRALGEAAEREFKERRLSHGTVKTYGTPRRLVLTVEALAGKQEPMSKEAMGPSKAVAFDASGQPTKAALGFAAGQGLSVDQLEVRQTPKGEYVFAVKREAGRASPAVLAELLPQLIGGLNFPKAMKWNASGVRFGRPIRWILALYDGRVIPFDVAGVRAGNRTWGHRFMGPTASARVGIPVKRLGHYVQQLERHGVVPRQEDRRKMILAQLETLSASAGGQVCRDEELLDQAVDTVECPQAVLGSFNDRFLSLPKDVLMTAMKEHQGFFSLVSRDGTLLPSFISITNMKLPNMSVIRRGNERVLAARLADAKFFFDEDRKMKLADRVEKLREVILHQKLGTLLQKTDRLVALADVLSRALGLPDLAESARRAARLSKADLLTGIVGEFPTLQGVMGGEYARHDGEAADVARAVSEQYLPQAMEGSLPQTQLGRILSLADRLDSVCAFFFVGMVPTGSEDPFALRRHALALVRLVVEGGLKLNMSELVTQADGLVAKDGFRAAGGTPEERRRRVLDFLFERLRYYGRTVHGLRPDVMEAVLRPLRQGACDLIDLLARMRALQGITARPDFDPLMVGFKRAHRLVEKEKWTRGPVDAAQFQHPSEDALRGALQDAGYAVPTAIGAGAYEEALTSLVRMKPAIDGFFEGVMVNAKEPDVRANRLSLLSEVDRLFLSFADFSQIVVAGA